MLQSLHSILTWLQRGSCEEFCIEDIVASIKSVYGIVPLGGGSVDGQDRELPLLTVKNPPTLRFTRQKDALESCKSRTNQEPVKLWTLLLESVQLPFQGDQVELQKALETLQDAQKHKTIDVSIATLRRRFFTLRKEFFQVRIELFHVAQNVQHPHVQIAQDLVNRLLNEGLQEALVDEMYGRQFYHPLAGTGDGGIEEREALVDLELQFLEEEALLRELLLLTLMVPKKRTTTTLDGALKIVKTVQKWETQVLHEVLTPRTLALPVAQQSVTRLTQVGVLVALRILNTADVTQEKRGALQQVTKDFFLTELGRSESMTSFVPGVLLLAWAALLGRQFHNSAECNRENEVKKELKDMLKTTLATAERLHSFYCLNALLRSLVFCVDYSHSLEMRRRPYLLPMSLHTQSLWTLPNVAASAGLCSANTTPLQHLLGSGSVSVYQNVVAEFLNEMLSSLGYMESIDGVQQLHAMVKFALPAISDVHVAKQILGIDLEDGNMMGNIACEETAALRELLTKTRAYLPHSLLPCIQMLTALCYNQKNYSSPSVIRQVVKYFSTPFAGLDRKATPSGVCRPLSPTEYFAKDSYGRLKCTRAFAYDDANGQLVVPAGTDGVIVCCGDVVQVKWLLSDSDEDKTVFSLYDLLMLSADKCVAGLQSGTFADLYRSNSEDVHALTSFLEFIVQLGRQYDGGQIVVIELARRWGEARLRRWWIDRQLPSPEVYVPHLLRQRIALSSLLLASRENLVSWGIKDRYTREQILVQIGDMKGFGIEDSKIRSTYNDTISRMTSFGVDGGIHLLRLLLGVLDKFLHSFPRDTDDHAIEDESDEFAVHLHLVAASFIALRTILAATSGMELFMNYLLCGGKQECAALIVKSAKKYFELQERLVGEYPVVLATQDILMSVVRWYLAKEAQSVIHRASSKDKFDLRGLVASERGWYVAAAEFAIEVLSTHEGWKFVTSTDRCEIMERCFRLLYVLMLPRKCIHESNDTVLPFESAMRETLSTDVLILRKLLRSSCAILSPAEGVHDEDSGVSSFEAESHNDCFLLRNKSDFDRDEAGRIQLESLVTTCLRLVVLLMSNQSDAVDVPAARKVLLASIDGRSSKEHKLLTIVTLCGKYLGYSQEKAPGIAYWSLKILQRAAVALDYREEQENRSLSLMHSLVVLFHGYHDVDVVRRVFALLLRVSSTHQSVLQNEVMEMLTLCLEHQPGFLALLLFGDNSTKSSESETSTKEKVDGDHFPFATILERFFEASERLLEQASDFLCALLTFLVQVWKGAISNRLGVHLKVMAALRARPAFWLNVTRVLKIHMPFDSREEHGLLDIEFAATSAQGNLQSSSSSLEAYIGRSSAYGYMARSLILQLVSYEWHSHALKQDNHPLMDVLESFRKEGLFSHWLRTFTRLDYLPAQFYLHASSIRRAACNSDMLTMDFFSDMPAHCTSMYIEGLICNTITLKWQLSAGGDFKLEASPVDVRALKMVQWSNLQAAYLHAQLFALSTWKTFMELCCLQTGEAVGSTPGAEKPSIATTSRQLKRKESMISSPPRNSGTSNTQSTDVSSRVYLTASESSTSSSESALSSRFSGDRTSFGMIRVLADVIQVKVNQHKTQDEGFDYFVLLHLHDLVQLLVSMLHHQLCLVLRKARDPKLSQTRQRLEESTAKSNVKLDAGATLELIAIVEMTISAVHDSIEQMMREVDFVELGASSQIISVSSIEHTSVSIISRLVPDYERRVKSVTEKLFTSLFTAALLLVRHLGTINNHANMVNRNVEMESDLSCKPLLQAKLIGHCMNVITWCDDRPQPLDSSRALFLLSRCLFQEVLDSFSGVGASVLNLPKLRMTSVLQLNALVKKLEHEQHGIEVLFRFMVRCFRPSSYSKEVAAKQEEAWQILKGLVAVVWNTINAELCQRVMVKGNSSCPPSSRLRLISILATQLLPLLQAQMEREEATSKLRGYMLSAREGVETDKLADNGNLERSVAHRMWCLVLDFVSGLLRLQTELIVIASDDVDVWSFMSSAEPLLLSAVERSTCERLTAATIAEYQALLRLLNALSRTTTRRKRWRQAFPTHTVILMEQSRQLLRRACVLLGSSSLENGRLRTERMQKKEKHGNVVSNAIVGIGASLTPRSPRSPRSPSAFTYAHQTLFYDHLQAVQDIEKRKLTEFYHEMETELVVIVQLASLLLTKWTASLTDYDVILVVDGVRRVDEEQLVPLLAFVPPSEARSTHSSLGLGHLSLAMEFMLDQVLVEKDSQPSPHMADKKSVLVNAVNACALLFFKTYLLYVEQYEVDKRDRDEFDSFFRQYNARLSNDNSKSSIGVDVQLLQYIGKTLAG